MIQRCFSKKNGEQKYQCLVICRDKSYFGISHSISTCSDDYKQDEIIQMLYFFSSTTYLTSLVDEWFTRWLIFQWVQIVLRYSPICFYMLMKQTSIKGFSRIKINKIAHVFHSSFCLKYKLLGVWYIYLALI